MQGSAAKMHTLAAEQQPQTDRLPTISQLRRRCQPLVSTVGSTSFSGGDNGSNHISHPPAATSGLQQRQQHQP